MTFSRVRVSKVLVVTLIATLFGGLSSVDISHATDLVTPTSVVTQASAAPTVTPTVTVVAAPGVPVIGSRSYCLSYSNNGFAGSRVGPATPFVNLLGGQEAIVTFPAPPSGKAYYIYNCFALGSGTSLLSTTPITGTQYIDTDSRFSIFGLPSGLPRGGISATEEIIPIAPNSLPTAQLKMSVSGTIGKATTLCFSETDMTDPRPVPLVDGQSITFSTSDRTVVDFYPAGTPGTGKTSSASYVTSGGKVCLQAMPVGLGSAYIGADKGQTYKTFASSPLTSQPTVSDYCVQNAVNVPDPSTGLITCTNKLPQSTTFYVRGTLSSDATSVTIAPSTGTATIHITSADVPLADGTIVSLVQAGPPPMLLSNAPPITATASGGIATFNLTAGSSTGSISYMANATNYSAARITVTIAVVPVAPTAVSATASGGSAVVAFTPPVDTSTVTGYTVTAYGPSGTAVTTQAGSSSPITVNGLTPGVAYTFKVVANGTNGPSAASTASSALTIPAATPGAPGTPVVTVNSQSTSNPTTNFSVAFTAPSNPGATPVTGYTATLYINGSPTALTASGTSSPITVALPSGSATPGNYTFVVTATNSAGAGTASSASNATTVAMPSAPSGETLTASTTAVTVQPAAVSGAISYTTNVYPAGTTSATGTPLGTCTILVPSTTCQVTGLSASTTYAVFTSATNSFGTGAFSAATSVTTTSGIPPLPHIPDTVTYSPAVSSFNISWSPGTSGGTTTDVTAYEAFVIDQNGKKTKVMVTAPTTTATITGLDPALAYNVGVYAWNGSRQSTDAGVTAVKDLHPWGPPIAPGIDWVSVASATADVNFYNITAAPGNGGLPVTTYTATVYIDGVATNKVFTSSSTPVSLTGLTPGVTYQVGLTAANAAGTSPITMSDPFTPQNPPAPAAPTGVSVVTGAASGQVAISYIAPTAPAGSTISAYTFTAIPSYGSPIVVNIPAGSATSPYTFSGLSAANGPYTFTVAATNQFGTSAPSTASVPYSMPQIPGAPTLTNVNLKFNSQTGTVTFSAPASNGGSPITKYTVKVYPTPSSGYGEYSGITSPELTDTATAGVANTITLRHTSGSGWYQYETVTVFATNMVGDSPESAPLPLIPGQPGSSTIVQIGNGEVTVAPSWPSAAAWPSSITVSAYDLTTNLSIFTHRQTHTDVAPNTSEYTVGGAYTAPSCSVTLPAKTCTITGLTNGHDYNFIARGFNSTGGGSLGGWISSPIQTVNVPSLAPTGVTAVAGSNFASIWWSVPSALGTSGAINYYTINAYPSSGTASTETSTVAGSLSSPVIFPGLVPGVSYTFTVSATTNPILANTTSAASQPSNVILIAGAPSAPSVPTATFYGTNASLAFSAPANNGSAITGYTFVATPVGGGASITQTTLNTSSPYTFGSLNPNTSYTFTMKATNAAGTSSSSSASTLSTRTLVIKPGFATIPAGTASVGFTPLYFEGGAVVDPTINNSGWVAPTCDLATPYSSSTPAGSYTISCSGAVGGSQFGTVNYQTDTLTVVATVPSAPTGVSATLGNTKAVVSFNTPASAGQSAITSYTVTAYVNGVATSITATGTSSPITVTGLTPGVNYSFVVTATNTQGASLSSIPSNPSVMPKTIVYVIPDPQTVSQGSPSVGFTKVFQTTAFDTSTVVVPAASNAGYVVPTCGISPTYSSTTAAGSYDISCSGGNGGSLYTFDFSYKSKLNVQASLTFPSAPTNVTATASGSTGATVAFTAPTIATPALSSYTVTAVPVGGGTPVTTTVSAPATSANISGLTPGTTYNFQVVAINSGGTSTPGMASLRIAGTPPQNNGGSGGGGYIAPPVTIPTAPTGVTASIGGTTGSNYAIVSFVAAATNGVTTSYTVTAQPGGISASGTGSPIRINGLTPGVNYTFTVTATNSAGTSAASVSSGTFVIPSVAAKTPYVEVPPSSTPGNSAVTVNGVATTVPTSRNVLSGTVNFAAKDWTLSLSAFTEAGKVATVGSTLILNGVQGGNVSATGTGFAPNSAVALYMFSKVYTLGTHSADSNGGFTFTDAIPSDIAVGEHTIQVVGYAPDGKIRTANVKILVKAAAVAKPTSTPTPVANPTEAPTTEPTTKYSASTKIFFNLNASFVDAKALATIKKFVAAVKKHAGPYKILVTGVVEPTPVNPFPVEVLSKARAVAFAAKLKAAGLKGKYTIRGDGLADHKGASARYAKVVVTWNA